VDGHHAPSHSGHQRHTRGRPRHPSGLLPSGRRPVCDLGRHRRIAQHPNWYYNPKVTAEVGTQPFTVLALELDDTARAELGRSWLEALALMSITWMAVIALLASAPKLMPQCRHPCAACAGDQRTWNLIAMATPTVPGFMPTDLTGRR